ncbi:MAG: HlyD family efflux transporter periplasmic adaptor subunit [Hydrogenophaga sp.]|uniref:HlyD family efflux transporter periplasmic adaptor subunit n=1 Tax=Hydrogenophaga sp. TaxID=1904254 RepID=UPI002ABA628F|nr:HlyD family efflux transporter periplasmic adaptor subunit [Hydrogenophaga sp.]MDZ4100982.1 HlyD family efflux transporter periplasmic adaptor subunit [Hydrogenophaga sp.]MDZ4293520.1 HlyD family efflux transporter periplasmic adaptor subunit [Hydrogenophaga sp.]
MEQVTRFLQDHQLLQPAGRDSAQRMAERLRAMRSSPWKWLLHHYLFFRLPLWQPDAWLNRWLPVANLFYTRRFAWITLFALLLGGGLVMRNFDAFAATFVDLFSLQGVMAYGLAIFTVKWLHELGHAFTAKRLGCRIPTMGVAFLVLWPMAYTDTNETWRLASHRQRLQVAVAGIGTELVIAVWATLAWALLPDGALRGAAFVLATTSWLATVAINASPFMRFDGYFILCDWLDMPNLHGRSFDLARWKLRETLFALGDAKPEHFSRTKERWLIAFAWTTWMYRLVIFIGIAILVYHFFVKLVGILLFVVELLWFIAVPVAREFKVWRERWPDIRSRRSSRQRLGVSLSVAAVVLSLLVIPWPGRVQVSAMLRPAQTWTVFVPGQAQLAAAEVRDGDAVPAGEGLWRLQSPEVELRQTLAQARLTRLAWQAAAGGLSEEGRERWLVGQEERQSAEAELAAAQEDVARYRVAAPFDGVLRDVNPDLVPGDWVPAKTQLGLLVAPGRMVIETYLEEADLKRLRPGDSGTFRIDGAAGPVLGMRLLQVDADASRTLALGALDAASGGHVLTRRQGEARIPEQGVFRALLELEDDPGVLAGRIWRGNLVLQAQSQSVAGRYLEQSLSVLLREAGL